MLVTLWNQTEGYDISMESEIAEGGLGDISMEIEHEGLEDGAYLVLVQIYAWSVESEDLSNRSSDHLLELVATAQHDICLLYTSPSPRD